MKIGINNNSKQLTKSMKKLIRKILCMFGYHRYYTIMQLTYDQRKVGCKRCIKTWGMHDGLRVLIPWDGELDQLYAITRGIKNIPKH